MIDIKRKLTAGAHSLSPPVVITLCILGVDD